MEIKKMFGVLVAALFVLSLLPFALAEDLPANDVKDKVSEVKDKKEKINDFKEAIKEQSGKVETAKDHVEEAKKALKEVKDREEYTKAKGILIEARQNLVEKKDQLLEVRKEFNECKQNKECLMEHAPYRIVVRENLLRMADVVLAHLEQMKQRVELSTMTAEEKAQLKTGLEERMTKIREAKDLILNAGADATKEEINNAIKLIREAWKDTQKTLSQTKEKLNEASLGNVVEKLEKLESKFARVEQRLKEKGVNTAPLSEVLGEFKAKIAEARKEYETARQKFADSKIAGKTVEESRALVKESQEHKKTAFQAIRDAREILKQVVKQLRNLNAVKEVEKEIEVGDEFSASENPQGNGTLQRVIFGRVRLLKPFS